MHVGRLFTNANCTRKFQESSQTTVGISLYFCFPLKVGGIKKPKKIHYLHGGAEMSNFCYAHPINPPPNRSTVATSRAFWIQCQKKLGVAKS
ncbi:hypothetical protein T4C_7257 [Trichinella pseudospiralis]|uniref:Uncharacterized protein n=1 Tax=Trichinella pseudospiralis TaxID=6337 RepID=A0A0V1IQN8_TRIPS|nr:hypothetical protein T4D_16802 [Trichinella pseudospiralis]KRZ24948.1 hypothetical protein T4C_7257 [Trichinella pseudospiralis]